MESEWWMTKQSHGRLVFFFVAKKKTRQLAGKAGTNRWSGSSTADNETCATFRKHSRRQEHDNVCGKISKMCGKKKGAGKRLPKPHGFISDGAREKSRACKQLRRPVRCLKSQRSGIVFS